MVTSKKCRDLTFQKSSLIISSMNMYEHVFSYAFFVEIPSDISVFQLLV